MKENKEGLKAYRAYRKQRQERTNRSKSQERTQKRELSALADRSVLSLWLLYWICFEPLALPLQRFHNRNTRNKPEIRRELAMEAGVMSFIYLSMFFRDCFSPLWCFKET